MAIRASQASRKNRLRVILSQAETEIAALYEEAAKSYQNNQRIAPPGDEHVVRRPEEKGALMLIPSSAVESMGMGGLMAPQPCSAAAGRKTGRPGG